MKVEKKAEPLKENVEANLLIALLLKVGGQTLTEGEIERAKTHTLTRDMKDGVTTLGAILTI